MMPFARSEGAFTIYGLTLELNPPKREDRMAVFQHVVSGVPFRRKKLYQEVTKSL